MNNRLQLMPFIILLMGVFSFSFNVISDLKEELADLNEGQTLHLEYSFEGCYGPYHHGSVRFNMEDGVVLFQERNFDEKGKEGISQSGKYPLDVLIEKLTSAQEHKSTEVLGASINYQIKENGHVVGEGVDRMDQAHFIEIFRPFSSLIKDRQSSTIPGLKNGGFVHP
ncbi:MAG: hypothetical protein KDC53_21260 [Saprospiraceae bacterium]|nr:hypothetical protein [Saprospiraceae bacterium]